MYEAVRTRQEAAGNQGEAARTALSKMIRKSGRTRNTLSIFSPENLGRYRKATELSAIAEHPRLSALSKTGYRQQKGRVSAFDIPAFFLPLNVHYGFFTTTPAAGFNLALAFARCTQIAPTTTTIAAPTAAPR